MTTTTKRIIGITAAVLLLIVFIVAIVACAKKGDGTGTGTDAPTTAPVSTPVDETTSKSEKPTKDWGEIFRITPDDTVTVSGSGSAYDLYVANDITYLQMYKYILVPEGIEWTIATDADMKETIPSKTVVLNEGTSTFYVHCQDPENTVSGNYILQVHRTEHCVVAFEGISEVQTLSQGEFANPPEQTPQKDGYTFVAWEFDFSQPVNASVTVSAVWQANSYTITYDPDGAEMEMKTQQIAFGEPLTLPMPTKDGFTFAGWFYNDTPIESGMWVIPSDVTLKAHWTGNTYTVTFDAAGGKFTGESPVKVAYGETITLPVPIRDGFVFAGWYNGETLCTDGPYTYTQDLNLVAHWNENATTLTFFENGGSKNSYTTVIAQGGELPVPTRSGYTFGGWFRDINLSEQVTEVPNHSMKLYAWWTEEGKPSEFVYELSGLSYRVTDRVDPLSNAKVPKYIGGIKTVNAISEVNPDAGLKLENDMLNVHVGRTAEIHATFIPYRAGDDTNLTYSSSDPKIATVDEKGVVTGVAAGHCFVTVTNEASGVNAPCVVIVAEDKNPAASLSFAEKTYNVKIGKTVTPEVVYVPEYDDDPVELKFMSENPAIASIDEKGVVTGLAEGSCKIFVADLFGKSAECTVVVEEAKASLTLSAEKAELETGESLTVTAVYEPAKEGDDTALTWKSSDESVATVDNGVITGVGEGNCIIIVFNADASCTKTVSVTVKAPAKPTEPTDLPTENPTDLPTENPDEQQGEQTTGQNGEQEQGENG